MRHRIRFVLGAALVAATLAAGCAKGAGDEKEDTSELGGEVDSLPPDSARLVGASGDSASPGDSGVAALPAGKMPGSSQEA